MTVTVATLVEAAYAAAVETTIYTATSKRAIIDKYSAYSATGGTLTVKLVQTGGSAGASNILASKTFAAGESYTFPEIVGHILAPGDFISEISGGASTVVRRISGREVT